jgi:excisionase family DNA binding protein
MVQERYITAREVAERVGLSPDTILRYHRERRIPGRRLQGAIRPVRFLWSEIEAAWDGPAQLSLGDLGSSVLGDLAGSSGRDVIGRESR